MSHRGPFQPLPFCDSVILWSNALLRVDLIQGTRDLISIHCWVSLRVLPLRHLEWGDLAEEDWGKEDTYNLRHIYLRSCWIQQWPHTIFVSALTVLKEYQPVAVALNSLASVNSSGALAFLNPSTFLNSSSVSTLASNSCILLFLHRAPTWVSRFPKFLSQ